MADTIRSLKKELKEYREYVESVFSNHKDAYSELRKSFEEHIWEPDAHNPAFLAGKLGKKPPWSKK